MTGGKSILVTAATEHELEGIRQGCPMAGLHFAVTGVGMVNTAMHLTRLLERHRFDLVVNVGIAGSFDPVLPIGSVVQVTEDRIAWFGAEDRDGFLPAEELGLCPADEAVFRATATAPHLPEAKAITVNMAHGSAASIRRTIQLYGPQVESMEGAAVFRVCGNFEVNAMQIRAISNRVEPRDREAWDIPLALNNLTAAVIAVLKHIDHGN